ncbi:hypothetical protein ACJIZ3_017549 [Penstemon smallii]|uniref:Uncharacterized protein n=1 Tax=Penstemon smallii TaxID=265156 RepID=A0ABD3SVW5_9LAMI
MEREGDANRESKAEQGASGGSAFLPPPRKAASAPLNPTIRQLTSDQPTCKSRLARSIDMSPALQPMPPKLQLTISPLSLYRLMIIEERDGVGL